MAYVVVLNLRAMVIRTAVTAFLGLVAAAYAEDRFHNHDWRWFTYAVIASLVLFFLAAAAVNTIARASK